MPYIPLVIYPKKYSKVKFLYFYDKVMVQMVNDITTPQDLEIISLRQNVGNIFSVKGHLNI